MLNFNKLIWNIQRFGFDPNSIYKKLAKKELKHSLLVVSIPKSGTHLIERAICLWPECSRVLKPTLRRRNNWGGNGLACSVREARKGDVLFAHSPWSQEIQDAIDETDTKVVFIYRNPLDVLLSYAHHIGDLKSHWLHEKLKNVTDINIRIKILLEGDPDNGIPEFSEMISSNLPWCNNSSCNIRFEELVGEKGGGSLQTQFDTLNQVWDYLGIGIDNIKKRRAIADKVFSKASPTFRKGSIGKGSTLNQELLDIYSKNLSAHAQTLGY